MKKKTDGLEPAEFRPAPLIWRFFSEQKPGDRKKAADALTLEVVGLSVGDEERASSGSGALQHILWPAKTVILVEETQ